MSGLDTGARMPCVALRQGCSRCARRGRQHCPPLGSRPRKPRALPAVRSARWDGAADDAGEGPLVLSAPRCLRRRRAHLQLAC
eukprot:917576-Rhodomonas_salina.1